MADLNEDLSDDEVFFGKMTLKEVKKNIWLNHGYNRTSNVICQKQKPERNSIKIIETHSQPNLRSETAPSSPQPGSTRDNRKSDESFIQMENLVSKLCLSPEKAAELNNTLDIVDYILNNGPNEATNQVDIKIVKTEEDIPKNDRNQPTNKIDIKTENTEEDIKIDLADINFKVIKAEITLSNDPSVNNSPKKVLSTPKTIIKKTLKASPRYFTPAKSQKKEADVFLTPSSNLLQPEKPIFKTPINSLKKPSVSTLRATPNKSHMYKHIKSPIATYIKKSIQVPMVTNICPKKTLAGCAESSKIPKLVKPPNKQDKENTALPTVAYKSAKNTKVVQVVDKEKPSQVAKKLLSTLPQPAVILKHEARQFNSSRKPLKHLPEDSIADLSCLQADLSVCTPVKPKH